MENWSGIPAVQSIIAVPSVSNRVSEGHGRCQQLDVGKCNQRRISRGVQKKSSDLPASKGCNGDAMGMAEQFASQSHYMSFMNYDIMVFGRGMEAASLLPPASSQRGSSTVHGPCLRMLC